MRNQKKEWFADWFDTPYYHILYKNRDDQEAKSFVTRLTTDLQLEEGARVLDLACGKGRHSVTLRDLGFDVVGVDLSEQSICYAKQFERQGLRFGVCDMREPVAGESFDAIFNLFTSFGYFDSIKENEKVISALSEMLRDEGLLVIDFMNAQRVIAELVLSEVKESEGITFSIERRYDGSHIFKNIQFTADGEEHSYTERVQAICLKDFKTLLEGKNFEILRTFGDFDLNAFNEQTSDRLIIVAQKKIWD